MDVAVAAVSASAVVGLLVSPVVRPASRPRRASALALCVALALGAAVAILALAGHAVAVVCLVAWVAIYVVSALRARLGHAAPGEAPGPGGEPEDDPGGGGGGGLRKPPQDPPPAPPSPGLDWDAFDEARETWAVRERV